ncbi:hypothetical protein [Burkholderia territorii]|uniref:hypothetical protein n=1 Tax=Burkholderia territorii TaxID=1503055 RepID=UPI000759A764|nr:hypothetical protein [Burkholderia territorii]KWA08766.1 hypothetical protein WT37_24800 [Burkholderia territorii]
MPNKSICEKLLIAQIARLSNASGANRQTVSASTLKLVTHRTDAHGLVWFSGCFLDGDHGAVICPFNLTLSKHEDKLRSATFQFAISSIRGKESRLLAFYSMIEYLERSGALPPERGLSYHVNRLTRNGTLGFRVALVEDYAQFRVRAAKDLPYDDSLIALDSFADMKIAA